MTPIKESAFYKYLTTLPMEERISHLSVCFVTGGSLFFELAEEFNEYNPEKLAKKIDKEIYG